MKKLRKKRKITAQSPFFQYPFNIIEIFLTFPSQSDNSPLNLLSPNQME